MVRNQILNKLTFACERANVQKTKVNGGCVGGAGSARSVSLLGVLPAEFRGTGVRLLSNGGVWTLCGAE